MNGGRVFNVLPVREVPDLDSFANEFLVWINKSWHNSVVGCMRCQKVCPENSLFMNRTIDAELFLEEETMLILKGTPEDRLPLETSKNLSGSI